MRQHLLYTDSTMQSRYCGEHEASCAQMRSRKNYCNEAKGKDDGADHSDQTRSILLIPRCRLRAETRRTSKCEQTAGHESAEEDLVDSHGRFESTVSRAELCCLLGRVSIVHDLHVHLDEFVEEDRRCSK